MNISDHWVHVLFASCLKPILKIFAKDIQCLFCCHALKWLIIMCSLNVNTTTTVLPSMNSVNEWYATENKVRQMVCLTTILLSLYSKEFVIVHWNDLYSSPKCFFLNIFIFVRGIGTFELLDWSPESRQFDPGFSSKCYNI